MKNLFFVAVMAMGMMLTSCQQSKEDYIKEFQSFVAEVTEECGEYTESDWKDAGEEFEALVKKAEKYEDWTAEETLELASIQAQYTALQAKKGVKKVIEGVKDLFGGKK